MKLKYNILWIDDLMEDYIELGIKNEFESYIESLGFIQTIDCVENGTDAQQYINSKKYDLILSDFNIEGESEQGNVLIQKIRDNDIFTEVLFYSARNDFEEIAKNLYRDRVSFFSLKEDEGYKGFKEKVFKLIDLTVSKLQEINSIRGLVMSETSELDNTIEEILLSFLSKGDDGSQKLKSYICDIILDSSEKNLKKAKKFCDLGISEIVKSRLFDAEKKSRSINKLIEIIGTKEKQFQEFYESYKEDVLDTRNDLAHAKSVTKDGIDYLLIDKKGEGKSVRYNQEKCIQIRKNLRKYPILLKEIRELITK